jgi:protein phosphatase
VGGDDLSDTTPDLPPLDLEAAPPPARVATDVGGRTHPGGVGRTNQDNFHVVQFGRHLRTVLSSLPGGQPPEEVDRIGYAIAVADGMGGRGAGDVASRRAIELLVEFALLTPDWVLGPDPALLAKVMGRTAARFRGVNEAVLAEGRGRPGARGMGTTLSLALTLGDYLPVAHVGDSPVCLFRGGRLHRLTRDHTLWQERAGYSAAAGELFRRVLTRAIGSEPGGGHPDVARYRLADGDRLLVCTDGLADVVDDESIARELGRGTSADEACRALIDLALGSGGTDDVTVVVATYRIESPH